MNKIVEEKTNIPVGDLQKQEETQLKNLSTDLKNNVIGQNKAVKLLLAQFAVTELVSTNLVVQLVHSYL